MSVDLGVHHWQLVGVDAGVAVFTNLAVQRSRTVDLHTWPPKLYPPRDEWTRAIGPGATLVGWKRQTVYVQKEITKQRTERALPAKQHGFRAIGMLGGQLCVVPGSLAADNRASPLTSAPAPLVWDGAWKPLAGDGGSGTQAAVIGELVVWSGRVLHHDAGRLVATHAGDLPGGDASLVPLDDGFATVGGGKLVVVTRHGKQREDRAVGKLSLVTILGYDGALLLGDGERYHRYDGGTHEPFDLGGVDRPDALIAAPCGLIALVDRGRRLVRLRV
jgi:hypothetical protein